jgi:hypothetical protein
MYHSWVKIVVWLMFLSTIIAQKLKTLYLLPFQFIALVHVDGVKLCLWTVATNRPVVHLPGDIWAWGRGRMVLTWVNLRTWRKTCTNAILSATNPTWTDLGVNPGFCSERPAINPVNHCWPIWVLSLCPDLIGTQCSSFLFCFVTHVFYSDDNLLSSQRDSLLQNFLIITETVYLLTENELNHDSHRNIIEIICNKI